jgi:hypothetical protein
MKRMLLKFLSLVLLISLLVSPAIAASEETDPRVEKLAEFEPVEAEVGEIYQQDKVDRYIVLLEGDSLVTYEG